MRFYKTPTDQTTRYQNLWPPCINIPVIATVDRGHKELIKNNYNGFLVKQNDGRELAADIAILVNNDKLGKKIAANGKKTVKKFLLSNVIKEMVGIYENK